MTKEELEKYLTHNPMQTPISLESVGYGMPGSEFMQTPSYRKLSAKADALRDRLHNSAFTELTGVADAVDYVTGNNKDPYTAAYAFMGSAPKDIEAMRKAVPAVKKFTTLSTEEARSIYNNLMKKQEGLMIKLREASGPARDALVKEINEINATIRNLTDAGHDFIGKVKGTSYLFRGYGGPQATSDFTPRPLSDQVSWRTRNVLDNGIKTLERKQGGIMNYLDYFKKGGIYIKPENRGKFTETKKRTGKTTEELTHSKNPVTRKRAIFALNAKKWHHAKKHSEGGILNYLNFFK